MELPAAGPTTRRHVLRALGAAAALGATRGRAAAQADPPRVALVIGNAAYARSPLRNPGRDARAMAELLAAQGFDVLLEVDADGPRMREAIARTAALLRGREGVGLLYYAGHGLQIDWRNYMLPVDIRIESPADVPRQGVDVQAVVQAFGAAGTRTNIVVLDACRDNPFGGAGASRGLAPMDAPPGTFFAYATAPGNVAEDGTEQDGNGLYTRFLLQELKRPESRIEEVFKRVRLQVRRATQGRQIPWESTSLEEDFVFASGRPAGTMSAQERLREFDRERLAWARVGASGRADDLYDFLQLHPSGPYAELAQFALDALSRPNLAPQLPPALTAPPLPSGVQRYLVGDAWSYDWIDQLRGDTAQRRDYRVTALEGPRVLVNGGRLVLDQMGSQIVNEFGRKDPGILMAPSEMAVGKRWRSAYTNLPLNGAPPHWIWVEHRVEALEPVEVPAGRFTAYRVAMHGESVRASGTSRLAATAWIDPTTMWPVRVDRHFTALVGGATELRAREDLVTMKRVSR